MAFLYFTRIATCSTMTEACAEAFTKGGPGSGNFGHSGRPGLAGGSAPSGSGGSHRVADASDRTVGKHLCNFPGGLSIALICKY
jgi:hypothetical protein